MGLPGSGLAAWTSAAVTVRRPRFPGFCKVSSHVVKAKVRIRKPQVHRPARGRGQGPDLLLESRGAVGGAGGPAPLLCGWSVPSPGSRGRLTRAAGHTPGAESWQSWGQGPTRDPPRALLSGSPHVAQSLQASGREPCPRLSHTLPTEPASSSSLGALRPPPPPGCGHHGLPWGGTDLWLLLIQAYS